MDLGQVDVDTLTTLGVCLARGGHWEIAAETFARALVLHGTAEVARENLELARRKLGRPASPVSPGTLLDEAVRDHDRGNSALACWAWMEFLKSQPRNQEIRKNLASVLVDRKWMGPALPHLEELVRGNPWDPALGTWLALVRFETGHRAKAMEALQAVFTLDPQFVEARRLEVDLTLREGRHEEAWWLVQRLCRDHPQDVVGRISRGVCAFHGQRWAEAVADLEWVLGQQPGNALVQRNLEAARERLREFEARREEARMRASLDEAGRLQSIGDLRGAIALLEPVTERRPDWAEAWDALGSLRYLAGDAEGARRDLLKANHLAPGLPDLQVRLAMACNACGRAPEAVALLDQVAEEQPLHAPAHRLRGDLLLEAEPEDARRS
ncbi:MAG: tetratricopeptide repeat protein, partial [Verrucomicrobiota bacterium]